MNATQSQSESVIPGEPRRSPGGGKYSDVYDSLLKLERWSVAADYQAFDTFDGLSSPLAPLFTLNIPLLKQVWQQGVRRFPLNLRPLLGIRRAHSSKGMGFFAQGYLRLYQMTGKEEYFGKMRFCLDWLMQHRCPQFKGNAWGNHFDYQHRAGNIPPGVPTIVWTGLIGHAFLDAYESLGTKEYLTISEGIAYFIMHELGLSEFDNGVYLHYYPGATHFVHNSSMIGASFLLRLQQHSPNNDMVRLGKAAVAWTVREQLPNGAWYYGMGPNFKWIDSFHTAYVLEALAGACRNGCDYAANLKKGYEFYVNTFFETDGTPRYYHDRRGPIDIQCASQAIQTLTTLSELHPQSAETAYRVARWTIQNMQDASGFFYYRKYPVMTNKTPTLHWGQATMFAALALLTQSVQDAPSHRSELTPQS